MPDLFTPLVKNMISFGFYNIFIWLLALAVMYAVLKKSKILGESPVINGAVALAIAFFVFAFPVLTGVNLVLPTATFFTQTTTILLFFIVAFIMASFFYPDLPKFLVEHFVHRTTIWAMVVFGIGLFVTSGLIGAFLSGLTTPSTPSNPGGGMTGGLPIDVIIIITGIVLFIVVLIIASSIATSRGE